MSVDQVQRLLQRATGEELLIIASMAAQMLRLPRGEAALAEASWEQARLLEGLWNPLVAAFEARAIEAVEGVKES
jgi:hypothetical protein